MYQVPKKVKIKKSVLNATPALLIPPSFNEKPPIDFAGYSKNITQDTMYKNYLELTVDKSLQLYTDSSDTLMSSYTLCNQTISEDPLGVSRMNSQSNPINSNSYQDKPDTRTMKAIKKSFNDPNCKHPLFKIQLRDPEIRFADNEIKKPLVRNRRRLFNLHNNKTFLNQATKFEDYSRTPEESTKYQNLLKRTSDVMLNSSNQKMSPVIPYCGTNYEQSNPTSEDRFLNHQNCSSYRYRQDSHTMDTELGFTQNMREELLNEELPEWRPSDIHYTSTSNNGLISKQNSTLKGGKISEPLLLADESKISVQDWDILSPENNSWRLSNPFDFYTSQDDSEDSVI